MSDQAASFAPRPPIFEVTTWIGLTAALIYATGWSYAYQYFSHFGLGLVGLDLPNDYFFIYGFWVVKERWLAVVIYLLAVLTPHAFPAPWRQFRCLLAPYLWKLAPLAAILLFATAYSLGQDVAKWQFQRQQAEDYPDYPRIQVWMKLADGAATESDDPRKLLADGCHRLLLESGGNLYFFRSVANSLLVDLAVLEVPRGEISALWVLPQYQSCPPDPEPVATTKPAQAGG